MKDYREYTAARLTAELAELAKVRFENSEAEIRATNKMCAIIDEINRRRGTNK